MYISIYSLVPIHFITAVLLLLCFDCLLSGAPSTMFAEHLQDWVRLTHINFVYTSHDLGTLYTCPSMHIYAAFALLSEIY